MADNVEANPGSGGAVFATDEGTISATTVHVPFTKVMFGTRNTFNEVEAASGKGFPVQGEAAHDAATTGNPLLQGAEARTSDGTAVASGDAVRLQADTLGKQVVLIGSVHDLVGSGTLNKTDNTSGIVLAAAGGSVRWAVTSVLVTNAHASVSTKVSIRDGTTAKIVGYAVAAGGGYVLENGGRPLFVGTANTDVTAICGTTGADVDVSISGYKISN